MAHLQEHLGEFCSVISPGIDTPNARRCKVYRNLSGKTRFPMRWVATECKRLQLLAEIGPLWGMETQSRAPFRVQQKSIMYRMIMLLRRKQDLTLSNSFARRKQRYFGYGTLVLEKIGSRYD
jgi:hypothetical protein